MSYALRVGQPAATTTRGPVRIPIEGARAVVDRDAVIVFIGFRDPTEAERAAVETEPVSLATLTREAVVSLLFEIGRAEDDGYITCAAPVNLHDPDAEPQDFLDGDGGAPIRFALCDSESGVVRALREVLGPDRVIETIRARGRAQLDAFASDLQVREASLRVLYGETVPALLARGERNVCA
ncbi:hypothetical protein [Rubricoccus marinus]|uniref:Uncharacterized protein n=1 Tax=Rubricoccus marinus TaxID=716817 RepID=A0A259TUD6_9BACT|nr:hypothetical protein [Rubricoccus marinus]OZC01341.1 hypothetical protein BSZ36_18035 [Rubricoccus marinus]